MTLPAGVSPSAERSGSDALLRDQLAIDRTRLANERTLLAYVRTALACLIAGAGFLEFGRSTTLSVVAWLLLGAGAALVAVGTARFVAQRRALGRERSALPPARAT